MPQSRKTLRAAVALLPLVAVLGAVGCSADAASTSDDGLIQRTSQALTQCSGTVPAFAGNFTTNCDTVTATATVSNWDIKLLHLRAQSYFGYLMGGPVPPPTLTLNGLTYVIRDSFWADSARNTGGRLCAMRNAIAAGHVGVENTGDTEAICAYSVPMYHFGGEILPSDGNGCSWSPSAAVGVGGQIAHVGKSGLADRGWCVQDTAAMGLPSFFNVAWLNTYEGLVDPEPVTLSASLGAGSGSSAAAIGDDTEAVYSSSATAPGGPAFRWSSTPSTCGTTLNNYLATKTFGVPCFTIGQTGTQTSKYIKKDPLNSLKCVCATPVP